MRFKKKILFLTLFASVPIISIMGGLNYYFVEQEITKTRLNELNAIASIQEARVLDAIEKNLERLQGITSRTQLRYSLDSFESSQNLKDQELINKIIQDSKSSIISFEDIIILNIKGEIVSATNQNYSADFFSETSFFKNGLVKNSFDLTSEINNRPQIILSGPLYLDEKLIGVAIAISKPDSIMDIIKDYSIMGETGETFLAKRTQGGDALFITPLRFDVNSQFNKIIDKKNTGIPITQALLKNEEVYSDTIDYRGAHVLSATRYIDSQDWGLVVKIDKKEALELIQKLAIVTVSAVVILVIVFIITSFIFANTFTQPLLQLRMATQQIANENYDVIITAGKDEVGELADDFIKMASSIKKSKQEVSSLKEIDRLKDEFLSMISHELKTPLVPIQMYSEMLLRGKSSGKLDEKERNQIKKIHQSAQNLERILGDFLDINRLEIKRLKLDKKNVKIKELAKKIIDDMKPFALEKNIDLILDLDDSWIVTCDPRRISQVISNLIKNSIDFVPENGKITLHVKQMDNSETLFTLEDNGPGIAPERADDLFRKFYQADTSLTRKHGGTGLGLAICKGIVKAHGGKIWFDKSYKDGARFQFTLPHTII